MSSTPAPAPHERRSHAVLDPASRVRKARKIVTIVERRRALTGAAVLEVGTGSGVMATGLAQAVGPAGTVCSLDVRDLRVAGEGDSDMYSFVKVGDTRLPFAGESFDVVVSNHVFEHVGDRDEQLRHVRELRRVLKPDGIVYFAVPNRYGLLEPHYRLPFLSWLPQRWADRYVRITGEGDEYDVNSPTRATVHDVSARAGLAAVECSIEAMRVLAQVEHPSPPVRLIAAVPTPVLRLGLPVVPTMVFLLRRDDHVSATGERSPAPSRTAAADSGSGAA